MKRRIEKWLKYREIYDNAEGDTWQEKVNSIECKQNISAKIILYLCGKGKPMMRVF